MIEEWKDIEGYAGKYQISNQGNVRSLNYHREGEPRLMKGKEVRGYKQVGLRINGQRKFYSVHRLVAYHFVDGYEPELQVNHKNLNKQDNRASNLEWVTPQKNTHHAIMNGRFAESSQKLAAANEKRKKRIIAEKGDVKLVFSSIREAATELSIDKKQIQQSLRREYPIAKGYKFSYA